MVKLNLLDISEEKAIYEKGSELTTPQKPAKEEKEFSLESVNELFQASQTSKQAEPINVIKEEEKKEEKKSEPEPTIRTSPKPSEIFETNFDEEESFEYFSKKRIFFIVAIIFIVLAAVIVYFLILPQKEEDLTPQMADVATEEMTHDQSSSSSQSTPRVQQDILNIFSKNKAKNDYSLNLAQKLMNTSNPDVGLAILIISLDQIQFSAVADSRSALTSYQNNLKSQFPGINIRLVNSEEMPISGQNKILADFTFSQTGPNSSPQISNFKLIKASDIKSTLNSLAQTHKLNLQYFKEGQKSQNKEFIQTKYYCNLIGNSNVLMKFIKEIIDSYPAIIFSKIAFNPSSLSTAGTNQFMARITMILNEPRTS
jgi:hypothetical protein